MRLREIVILLHASVLAKYPTREPQLNNKPYKSMNYQEQYAALIFDCDGTLSDSMPVHFKAWTETMNRYGITFPEDRFYSMGGMPTEKIIQMLAREQSIDVDASQAAAEKENAFKSRMSEIVPRENVCEIAREYFQMMPMAVASGSDREVVQCQLETLSLIELFPIIVTSEDTSCHKPEPDVFLKAAEGLSVLASTCLVFEDSPLGIEAARRASMDCIDVRDFTLHRHSS